MAAYLLSSQISALFCAATLVVLAVSTRGQPAVQPERAQVEGLALADQLREDRPLEDFETRGVLEIQRGNAKRTETTVNLTVRADAPAWRSTYLAFAKPAPLSSSSGNSAGLTLGVTEELVVIHAPDAPNAYLWAKTETNAALAKPTPVASDQADVPFAGSDFWLTDLGLEFFHWPSQHIVKREMRKSRSCRVLESVNPNPHPGGYGRVLSWIDFETTKLVRAEAYDRSGKLLKEFEIISLKKVNGRMQLKSMRIRNLQTDSRTTLKFEFEFAP